MSVVFVLFSRSSGGSNGVGELSQMASTGVMSSPTRPAEETTEPGSPGRLSPTLGPLTKTRVP